MSGLEITVIGTPYPAGEVAAGDRKLSYSLRIQPEDLTLRETATALRDAASMLDEMIKRGIGT